MAFLLSVFPLFFLLPLFHFVLHPKSLHPSELREGWCAFYFFNKLLFMAIDFLYFHHQKGNHIFQTLKQTFFHWFCYCLSILFCFFCHTFSVVVPVETVPCSVSEFMTVQQVAHVVNLEAEQWEVDFCICLTVCLHAHLLTSDPPSPLPRQCSCLGLLLAYRKSGSRKNGAYSACRHSNIFASVSHR